MADFGFNEAFRVNEFVVEIENIESPNVTKVSGLSDGEVDAIEQHDAGSSVVHKISNGVVKFGDLTIERNLDGSTADDQFRKWFVDMFGVKGGKGPGSLLRRNGSIVKKHGGNEVARWTFEGAWMKSSKFADLDASASGLLKQTIVLAIERMYRT